MKQLTVPMKKTEWILGLVYIALQVFVIPLIAVIINELLPQPFSAVELNFIVFAFNFLCVTVIFHRFLIESVKIAMTDVFRVLRYAGLGFVLYYASSILVNMVVLAADPSFSNANDDSIAIMSGQNPVLMSMGAVWLVPVVEETLYRGVVFGQLHKRNPILAYVISTAVFASLHVIGYLGLYPPLRLLLCFIQYIPAGIFLAWTYVRADTILAPILIHIAVNQIGMLAMK